MRSCHSRVQTFQQLSITSQNSDPFTWPLRPNTICLPASAPVLFPTTPPSFTEFALATPPSFLFVKHTNVVLLQVSAPVLAPWWGTPSPSTANNGPRHIHLNSYTCLTTVWGEQHFDLFILHPSSWNVTPRRQGLSVLFTDVTPVPNIGSSASIGWINE